MPSKHKSRKSQVATLISDTIDFRANKSIQHRKTYYIMIKSSVHQKDTAVLGVQTK